jgi:hypothetical protein
MLTPSAQHDNVGGLRRLSDNGGAYDTRGGIREWIARRSRRLAMTGDGGDIAS